MMPVLRNDYKKALKMRLEGKSYGEIKSFLGVPKSTQSVWFKNLSLPTKAKSILVKKQANSVKFFSLFNLIRNSAYSSSGEERVF